MFHAFQELRDAKPDETDLDATGGRLGLDCDLEDPPGDPPSQQRYLSLPAPKFHNGVAGAGGGAPNGLKLSVTDCNGHVNYVRHNDSGVESQVRYHLIIFCTIF